ncbi:MAG: M6 family metalloprotease domain-containing protein [Thermoanaerobaculaceae bacterium]
MGTTGTSRRAPGWQALTFLAVVVGLACGAVVLASPPESRGTPSKASPQSLAPLVKEKDEPNAADYRRMRQRQRALERLYAQLAEDGMAELELGVAAAAPPQSGTDRVLVILVEFGGSDTFTWTLGQSTWDPLGKTDTNEAVKDANGNVVVGDCSKIITATRTFTYTGPLHNQIARPLSASDRSGDMIWVPDFNRQFYEEIIAGNGIRFSYQRQDGSTVDEDLRGFSVNDYYQDLSGGRYSILADVVGWLSVPHSTWWYGADTCPGRRSGNVSSIASNGAVPNAGSSRTLVQDALGAVKAAYPSFDWKKYDQDKDGVIDRLWIIHAGLGEEDSPVVLDRTTYGESALWSHSSSLNPQYDVAPGVKAGPYIMMPENAGIGVLAHEYGHNLGADDLYAYGDGETSAGFWTLMADDWTGYPIGYLPPAVDPWHLDNWGWLDPYVVTDPTRTHTVKVGQASNFPAGADVYRGVRIPLPDGQIPLPVAPVGTQHWWGGSENWRNATMVTRTPVAIPAGGATLSFSAAWDIEQGWDFLWVQASADNGSTWTTLANAHTTCTHNANWIGGNYGFPADMCAAGIGGFTGKSAAWPSYQTETINLQAFAGRSVLLRFWYMTDSNTLGAGPFVDDLAVSGTSLSDNAEGDDSRWRYADGWRRYGGTRPFSHNLYLQWRNVGTSGGYDRALGDPRWRYGPSNTGLLVWYNNNIYTDNEVNDHLRDWPGFGPKGRMLVVDAHPEPYRDPGSLSAGYANEGANMPSRGQMRDAAFSLQASVPFTWNGVSFQGRQAMASFADATGYYPGAEYVSRGPGYTPPVNIWATRQWDASVVPPSSAFVGIKAPGYTANTELRYKCSQASGGKLNCTWLGSGVGLGYDGGTGNPGDVGGAYGWNVEVLSQTDTGATLKIWNTAASCSLVCDAAVPATALTFVPVPFAGTATAKGCGGAPSFGWELGDGTASTSAALPHAFSQAGTYDWTFTASVANQRCIRTGRVAVTASAGFAYVVPSVAHASGSGGSQWRTNVAAVNPGAAAANLTLTYAQYESGGTPVQRTHALAAGATKEWQDILVELFGFAASAKVKGTVTIASDRPLVITSRTYNQTATGTYGQYYPALTPAHACTPGRPGVVAQLKRSTAFRANVGVQAIGATDAKVALKAHGATGAQVGRTVTRTVAAGRYWQADDFLGPSFANAGDQAVAYVSVTVDAGAAWVYASVVDNGTGDPTTLPVLPVNAPGAYVLPSVAHATGSGGSQWRTNAAAVNPGADPAHLTLTYAPYESGGTPITKTHTLAAGATREWQDILVELFGFAASAKVKGTVTITSDRPLVITSRTYNQTANGTYGQYYPALTSDEAFTPGQVGVVAQLKRSAAFRTNVGVQAVGQNDATVVLKARSATGAQVGKTVTRSVAAGRYWQADDFFGPAHANAGDQPVAYVTVEVTAGAAWVYGSVVDNATGDPTTLPVLVP